MHPRDHITFLDVQVIFEIYVYTCISLSVWENILCLYEKISQTTCHYPKRIIFSRKFHVGSMSRNFTLIPMFETDTKRALTSYNGRKQLGFTVGYVTSPRKKWSYQVGPTYYFEQVFFESSAKRKEKAKSFQEDLRPGGDAALDGHPLNSLMQVLGFGLWVKRVQQKH